MKTLGIVMVSLLAVAGGIAAATYITKKKLEKENEEDYFDGWDDDFDDDWDFDFDADTDFEDDENVKSGKSDDKGANFDGDFSEEDDDVSDEEL